MPKSKSQITKRFRFHTSSKIVCCQVTRSGDGVILNGPEKLGKTFLRIASL